MPGKVAHSPGRVSTFAAFGSAESVGKHAAGTACRHHRPCRSKSDLLAYPQGCRRLRLGLPVMAVDHKRDREVAGAMRLPHLPHFIEAAGAKRFANSVLYKEGKGELNFWAVYWEEPCKLLLVARKIRRATCTEFTVSLAANEFSRTSKFYIGKLRSDFLGRKFTIYDSQHQRTHPIRAPARGYNVANISYELNLLRTRGPRRMQCALSSIPFSAIQEGGAAPTPLEFTTRLGEQSDPLRVSKAKYPSIKKTSSATLPGPLESIHGMIDPLVLKNKAPRWHEQLQCWCLNFKGRVTVASVKNFQLVAAIEPHQTVPASEPDRVILQFGKIGKDIFTMDYCYPLSAFKAFAICLSSFDTKPACE